MYSLYKRFDLSLSEKMSWGKKVATKIVVTKILGVSHISILDTLSIILTLLGGWVKRYDAKLFLKIIDFLLNGKTKEEENK